MRHQGELFAGDLNQYRHGEPQREAIARDHHTRQFEIDECVVRDDGAAAGREMGGEPAEKAVEQAPPVEPARTPARQPAGEFPSFHWEMRQVGDDKVEAPPDDRQPHITVAYLHIVAMPEPTQQKRTRCDGFALDVDAAERGGAERAEDREHDAAA